MERKLKRQKRTVGSIVKIPLEDGYHTYARILDYGVAFYDARTKAELSQDEIVKKKVLFRTGVYDDVITKGYWLKVGKPILLEAELLKQKPMYTEDTLNDRIIIHFQSKRTIVTRDEVNNIESASVWDYGAIEKRLNDYYAGRKNEAVEFMRIGRPISGRLMKIKI